MATFATPSDVKDCFRNMQTLPTNPAVDDTQIQKWLDSVEVRVLGKVYELYQGPFASGTNDKSILLIAQIEAFFVAGIVDDKLNTYSDGDKKPNWEKRAQAMLDEIAPSRDKDGIQPEPLMKLPDAVYLGTVQKRARISVQNTGSGTRFTKGGANW